jgi:hypothetical protein
MLTGVRRTSSPVIEGRCRAAKIDGDRVVEAWPMSTFERVQSARHGDVSPTTDDSLQNRPIRLRAAKP